MLCMPIGAEITLLSLEEYTKYKDIIPLIKDPWWWLKDSDIEALVHGVCDDGSLCGSICNFNSGVRPALKIHLSNSKNLKSGDKIRLGSKDFTVLSWEESELFALCDEFIAIRKFDSCTNEWKSSELKQWLETEGVKLIF